MKWIKGVSINDLAVSYSSGKEVPCSLTHIGAYVQNASSLKVHGLRREGESGEHIIECEVHADLNRPGEDASAELVWQKVTVLYNEFEKTGKILPA